MSMIHQELQNLKHQLDSGKHRGSEHDLKLMKKIENLKEQFREYLVEVRKRKAAQTETAMFLSEDDSTVSSKKPMFRVCLEADKFRVCLVADKFRVLEVAETG